ncbi:TPA: 2,5-didehydrogluconate reductase DkgA [Escherichia coli]
MANPTVIKLQDGNVMPQLGLGVWQASNEEVITAIQKALEVGYRSIDTAAAYKNEEGVGKALKNASVNREELFITTKLWNDDHKRPREALLDSLKKLQLDYIDLYLMHWPVPAIDHYVEAWKGMIELQKEGLIKSIGVCNFQIHHLQRLIDETGVTPVINQIELHPLMQQRQLHAWNATHKIQTESWSPLAQGGKGVFDQKVIRDLADKYGKTPAQIVIRWHLDSGLVLESVAITQTDADHADAVVRFRIFKDDKEKTTQTLKMVAENGRWVIDDIVSNHGSVLQAVNSENEKTLAALASLQKEQPEAFVAELFEHIADYSWPWTWVVSDSYRQAVNAFYKTTFKTANNPDEDMQIERQFIYDNPICFGEESLFSRVDEIRVLEKTADSARIHVRFTLTNGNNEEQELVLQRREGKWEIADFIRPNSGSLLKQIEAKTAARLKQ